MFIQDSASRIMSSGHPPGLVYLAVDEPEGDLAQGETDNDSPKTDLHVRSYAERHVRSYADTRSRVLVIDEDLGHSATGIDTRPGFARLVWEVGLNHVGLVLGIEMSRLARSGREWHQLLSVVRAVRSAAGRSGRNR